MIKIALIIPQVLINGLRFATIIVRDVDVKLFYYLYPDIDISNYEKDYPGVTKFR